MFKPDGWHTITPRLITSDVGRLVDFLRATFDAEGEVREGRPCEIRIGDSVVLVSDGGNVRTPFSAFLYVYVEDADDTFRRAVEAGAEGLEEPADMAYGDRRATLRDHCGNVWQIATFRGR
jgi:PhnB protein